MISTVFDFILVVSVDELLGLRTNRTDSSSVTNEYSLCSILARNEKLFNSLFWYFMILNTHRFEGLFTEILNAIKVAETNIPKAVRHESFIKLEIRRIFTCPSI